MTRRDLLGRTTALGALAVGPAAADGPREPGRKLSVVVVGGHPGDPEYGCGGTVARYADLGHRVALLYLNRGERPGQPKGVRAAEAEAACKVLGARAIFADQVDGESVVDAAHAAAFRALLEAERPDVVFAHWPIDNHADHRAASMLVYDAWLAMKRSFALVYYEVSDGEDTAMFGPSLYVDITAVEPRKRAACHAHASQAPGKFYALQDAVARFRGIERGVARAEAFARHVQGPDVPLPG